jgi:spore coat protein U-like protein
MTEWIRYIVKVSGKNLRRTQICANAAALLLVMCQPLSALADCSFRSVTDVGFGAYNVFDMLPNTSGVGSISIRCQGGSDHAYEVNLSTGQSHSYVARMMKSGANTLTYNIYTNASRTIVWGDGHGGSSTQTAYKNSTTTLDLFGQIPAGQDVANGLYTDSLIVTVNF